MVIEMIVQGPPSGDFDQVEQDVKKQLREEVCFHEMLLLTGQPSHEQCIVCYL